MFVQAENLKHHVLGVPQMRAEYSSASSLVRPVTRFWSQGGGFPIQVMEARIGTALFSDGGPQFVRGLPKMEETCFNTTPSGGCFCVIELNEACGPNLS